MSNKLTKDKLDLLIEQVLSEDLDRKTWLSIMPDPIRSTEISKGGASGLPDVVPGDVFKSLSNKGTTPSKLDITDIKFFQKNPEKINTKIQSQLIAISRIGFGGDEVRFRQEVEAPYQEKKAKVDKYDKKAGEIENQGKKVGKPTLGDDWIHSSTLASMRRKIKKAEPKIKNKKTLLKMAVEAEKALAGLEELIQQASVEKQSIVAPRFRPVTAEAGGFPPEQLSVVERVVGKEASFQAKLEKVSEISKKFYDADKDELSQMKPSELLSNIQFLDIMNSFVKEFDSGSGAYLFEYFLALMAGGTVTGKDKTASGKMGAVDFMIGDSLGSAKYIKTMKGATQAKGGFEDIYNKTGKSVEMLYVIALKKQDQEQRFQTGDDPEAKQARGVADPTRIIGLEIYMPKVVYDGKKYTVNGATAKKDGDGKIIVGANPGEPVGFVYITKSRTSTFRQMIDTAIDTQKDQVKAAFEQFKKYFQSLEDASAKAKIYINKGDQKDGNEVYSSLNNAESEFEQITGFLEYGNKPVRPVAENKKNQTKSLKDLDKLIEGVILNKINK